MKNLEKIRLLDQPRETESQSTVGSSNGTRKLPPSGSGSGGVDASGSGTYTFGGGSITEGGENAERADYTWQIECIAIWSASGNSDSITFNRFDVTIRFTSYRPVILSDNKIEYRKEINEFTYDNKFPFERHANGVSKICDNIKLTAYYVVKRNDKYEIETKGIEKRAVVGISAKYDATAIWSEDRLVAEDGYINI